MVTDQQIWQSWANSLQRWGLADSAVLILDLLGPVSILGAQLIYLSQPFFPNESVRAASHLLENPDRLRAFTGLLKGHPFE
jgi:hypothetical protein